MYSWLFAAIAAKNKRASFAKGRFIITGFGANIEAPSDILPHTFLFFGFLSQNLQGGGGELLLVFCAVLIPFFLY